MPVSVVLVELMGKSVRHPSATADGTALSDITLAWMISKASALGLQFAPGMAEKYALPVDPKHALDSAHESWNIRWAFPKRRVIAPNSTLADSVFVRCEHDNSYRPQNLKFEGARPAAGYARAAIVTQAVATAA